MHRLQSNCSILACSLLVALTACNKPVEVAATPSNTTYTADLAPPVNTATTANASQPSNIVISPANPGPMANGLPPSSEVVAPVNTVTPTNASQATNIVISPEPQKPAMNTGTPLPKPATIGTQVDDTIVTGRVRSAFMRNPDVNTLDIKVQTNKGEVMLSGFVDNQYQVDRSISIAKSVEGVTSVDNKLTLKNGPSTVGRKIDDGVITAKVKSALLNASDLKSRGISVVTNKGVVQLSGFVDNDAQGARAAQIAQGVEGVTSVINELGVKK